jgi:uncharacterized protein
MAFLSSSAIESIAQRAQLARQSAENVPSPCTSVCRMNRDSGLCEGCLRTIDEICQWSQATAETKRVVWGRIAERALALQA